jgi:ComF family protein
MQGKSRWCESNSARCNPLSENHDISPRSLLFDILDFVYPPLCQVCRQGFEAVDRNIWLCENCRSKMQTLPLPMCPVCRTPLADPDHACSHCRRRVAIAWLYSIGTYDEYWSHLIKAVKYTPKPDLGKFLAGMLAERLRQFPQMQRIDSVCAVPIHDRKEAKRGFNQAEIIAKEVARALQLVYQPGQLVQAQPNRDQIGLNLGERFRNVQGIYQVSDDFTLKGKSILLVDDVTTSGATLNSAATTLLEAGAKSVSCATLAMALEDDLDPVALYQLMSEDF